MYNIIIGWLRVDGLVNHTIVGGARATVFRVKSVFTTIRCILLLL